MSQKYCHNLYALSRFWQQNMSKKFCQWDLKKVHSDLGERLFFQSMLEPDIGNNIKFPNFPIPTSCWCLMSIYQITHVIYFGPVFKMRQFWEYLYFWPEIRDVGLRWLDLVGLIVFSIYLQIIHIIILLKMCVWTMTI